MEDVKEDEEHDDDADDSDDDEDDSPGFRYYLFQHCLILCIFLIFNCYLLKILEFRGCVRVYLVMMIRILACFWCAIRFVSEFFVVCGYLIL